LSKVNNTPKQSQSQLAQHQPQHSQHSEHPQTTRNKINKIHLSKESIQFIIPTIISPVRKFKDKSIKRSRYYMETEPLNDNSDIFKTDKNRYKDRLDKPYNLKLSINNLYSHRHLTYKNDKNNQMMSLNISKDNLAKNIERNSKELNKKMNEYKLLDKLDKKPKHNNLLHNNKIINKRELYNSNVTNSEPSEKYNLVNINANTIITNESEFTKKLSIPSIPSIPYLNDKSNTSKILHIPYKTSKIDIKKIIEKKATRKKLHLNLSNNGINIKRINYV